jgi:hypothetical protein
MKQSSLDRAVAAWAKEWSQENLSEEVRKLINLTNYDLYFGPIGDGAWGDPALDDNGNENEWAGYPGFVTATNRIQKELRELPSNLYLDVDTGLWQEKEPEPEKCQTCDGEGTVGDDDPTHQQVRKEKCPDCDGRGGFEPYDDWYLLDRHDLIQALVGKELASYVS